MRVAVDTLGAQTGGGVTYLRSLLGAAVAEAEDLELVLAASDPEAFGALRKTARVQVERPHPPGGLAGRLAWEQTGLARWARQRGADVLFCPSEISPVRSRVPVVLGLQNPNLYERPARFGWSQRARLRVLLAAARACARRAAALVFVSEPFRRTAAAALGPLRAPQSVVEPGLDPIFHAPPGDGFDELRPYVLSVSDFYPYKNFASLVQAFARLGRPDLRLVIAGRPLDAGSVRETREAARAAGVAARVELLGAVRFERMPALYARAECFAFPSLLESFGFPPLEAMACGTPVACSSASVMPAVCGDGPLYFDPLDPADIAAAIARVLDDEPLRARLREAGRARAAAFDWSRSGRLLVEVLASTAARRGG